MLAAGSGVEQIGHAAIDDPTLADPPTGAQACRLVGVWAGFAAGGVRAISR
jgi:hypothetical protein